jgi:cytochrome c oxidase subunit I
MTTTVEEQIPAIAVPAHNPSHAPQTFLRTYVFSMDHKVIGVQYLLTSAFAALASGTLAMIMRLHLAWPQATWPVLQKVFPHGFSNGVLNPDFYLSIITMHGTLMVFFFISYALIGAFGNYLIPLQIGARDMAYPLLNMLSYWFGLAALVVMLSSFFVEGGGAASGWTAYPPLSAVKEAVSGSAMGQTFWILGMALFIVSFTMGGLNYFVTIINMRAPGMTWMRLPLTIWSFFVATCIGLVAFPPLTAAAVMLLFDRHGGTSFFLPGGLFFGSKLLPNSGGVPLLWQHLFWFLGHPEVYVLILPAWGIAFDILSTFSRRAVFGYKVTIWSFWTIAVLGSVVWGHHMFVSGMSPFIGEVFSLGTLLVTIPSAIIGFNLLAGFWGGSLRFQTPMLFVIGLTILFGLGGFGGIFLGNATSDLYLHDTYFVVGHFHFMIGGVTLFGIFAGIYYWFPKIFGRMMNESLGKLHFWLTLPSFYFLFLWMHYMGLGSMPRRYYAFYEYKFMEALAGQHVYVSSAAFILGAAQLIFLFNFFWSLRAGKPAGENPWEANTLEWAAPSPPPHGNWPGSIPRVFRWPYEFISGAKKDYLPQSAPAADRAVFNNVLEQQQNWKI